MTEVVKKIKEPNHIGVSKIDSRAIIYEPIDFSFKDMLNFQEINEHQPRVSNSEPKKSINGKYLSLSLKLGYNALADLTGLYEWCELNFESPENITSLDLSFNCLQHIPEEILKFPNLKCLYLHGNKIREISELDKLKKLEQLTSIACHGNPMEKITGFRNYILKNFPMLKQVNFGGISKADRQTAEIWIKGNKKPLRLDDGNLKKEKTK